MIKKNTSLETVLKRKKKTQNFSTPKRLVFCSCPWYGHYPTETPKHLLFPSLSKLPESRHNRHCVLISVVDQLFHSIHNDQTRHIDTATYRDNEAAAAEETCKHTLSGCIFTTTPLSMMNLRYVVSGVLANDVPLLWRSIDVKCPIPPLVRNNICGTRAALEIWWRRKKCIKTIK